MLPDYGFKSSNTELPAEAPVSEPVVDTGKTVSGLVGGALTLFLAGLLGIGGGVILVPLFIWGFKVAGVNPEVIVHLSFGTSLAIIIPLCLL